VKGGQNRVVSMKHEGSVSGRTSVKKLLPPQAMRGISLGMRGLVRSYVTLAIKDRKETHIAWCSRKCIASLRQETRTEILSLPAVQQPVTIPLLTVQSSHPFSSGYPNVVSIRYLLMNDI
jgi:hypothetical protein